LNMSARREQGDRAATPKTKAKRTKIPRNLATTPHLSTNGEHFNSMANTMNTIDMFTLHETVSE